MRNASRAARVAVISFCLLLAGSASADTLTAANALTSATPASSLTAATMLANAIPAYNNPAIDRFFANPSEASVPIVLTLCNREPDPQACKDAVNAVDFGGGGCTGKWQCAWRGEIIPCGDYKNAECKCPEGTDTKKFDGVKKCVLKTCEEFPELIGSVVTYPTTAAKACTDPDPGSDWWIWLIIAGGVALAGFLFWFFYWRKRNWVNCPKDPMHPRGKPGTKCKCEETYPESPKADTPSGPSGDSSDTTPDSDSAEDSSLASAAAVTSAVAAGAALATPASAAAPEGEAVTPSDPVALTKAILENDEARNMLAEQVLLQVGEKVHSAIGESLAEEINEMISNVEDSVLEEQGRLKAAQENGDPITEAGCEAAIQALNGHRKKLQERYDHVIQINSPANGDPDQGPPPPPVPEGDK